MTELIIAGKRKQKLQQDFHTLKVFKDAKWCLACLDKVYYQHIHLILIFNATSF